MAEHTTCKDCGAKHPKPEKGEPHYEHHCPPPREPEARPKVVEMPKPTLPPHWPRLRALLVKILDWIEGKL
jgi:hypothetical protein